MNKSDDIQGLRVYGLLTDLTRFKFYSYDPATNQFCFDETIIINVNRIAGFSRMMHVSNKIFGVVLSGYMDTLHAHITKSEDRGNQNHTGPLELSGELKAALMLAEDCCAKFKEPATSLPDIEEKANEALGLLTKSVRSIPRASIFTGRQDYDPAELKALATRVAKETYECYLKQ